MDFTSAGPEKTKNLAGASGLRLIRDPFETGSLEKITAACQAKDPQPQIAASSSKNAASFSSAHASARYDKIKLTANSCIVPFQFHERSQDFVGSHDETLSIAMRVHNADCAPFAIER